MNAEMEELLTEQMHRQAAEAQWRPELLRGALRLRHRRRVRRRGAAVTATACIAAGALAVSLAAAAPAPGGRTGSPARPPQAHTAAYVVHRAMSAMTGAKADVLEVQTHASYWSARTWFEIRPVAQQRIDFWVDGRLESSAVIGSRLIVVDFLTRTWAEERLAREQGGPTGWQGFVEIESDQVLMTLGEGLPTPQNIRHELADDVFRFVGVQTVGRTRLLHLQSTSRWAGGGVSIWVNASTYLPVRSSFLSGPVLLTARLTWLPATRAILSVFRLHIPAGFKRWTP
jgi:hypothetical protein